MERSRSRETLNLPPLSNMGNPEADSLILNLVPWQAFGSCTFRSVGNHRRAVGLFLRVLRRATALWNCKGEALWVLRFERGEMTSREHFHFLVGGFPTRHMAGCPVEFFTSSGCLWWVHEWTCLSRGGWSRVRPINEKDMSVTVTDYLRKGLSNRYEQDKFNCIHFSKPLLAFLEREGYLVNSDRYRNARLATDMENAKPGSN